MDECIMHICVCLCACSLTFNISFFLRSLPKGKSSARGRVARRNEEILSIALSLSLSLPLFFFRYAFQIIKDDRCRCAQTSYGWARATCWWRWLDFLFMPTIGRMYFLSLTVCTSWITPFLISR